MKTTATLLALLSLVACSTESKDDAHAPSATKASCRVQGTAGNEKVKGVVTFTLEKGKVRIRATVEGLAPGDHGFHIHQWGDIDCVDGKCAGGHYDPHGVGEHGAPDADKRHAGDLGNLKADATGKATYDRLDSVIGLSGAHSILGRSIIIHAKPDDFGQPTGNAGGRVGYGVIGIADPSK